jgi:hypothetical protein
MSVERWVWMTEDGQLILRTENDGWTFLRRGPEPVDREVYLEGNDLVSKDGSCRWGDDGLIKAALRLLRGKENERKVVRSTPCWSCGVLRGNHCHEGCQCAFCTDPDGAAVLAGNSLLNRFVADRTSETHPIPPVVRQAVLARAKSRCEDCGRQTRLELHHLTYHLFGPRDDHCPEGPPIFGFEEPSDLKSLCRTCHLDRHINAYGEFVYDPEEVDYD